MPYVSAENANAARRLYVHGVAEIRTRAAAAKSAAVRPPPAPWALIYMRATGGAPCVLYDLYVPRRWKVAKSGNCGKNAFLSGTRSGGSIN